MWPRMEASNQTDDPWPWTLQMKMKGPKGKMCVGIPGFSWKVCDHSCHKEILFFFFFPFPFSFFFLSLCLLGLFFAFLLKFVLLRGGCKGGLQGGDAGGWGDRWDQDMWCESHKNQEKLIKYMFKKKTGYMALGIPVPRTWVHWWLKQDLTS